MVHALREIRNLLNPSGALVDIRPDGELNEFIRPLGDDEHLIGYLHETDDYIEYRQAETAVREVLAAGLFHIEKSGEFTFNIHADSFDELKVFLDETWSDSLIEGDVMAEAKRLNDAYGVGKVLLRGQTRIALMNPIFQDRK
ncbi:MAG: hypothetical protein HQ525_11780 [Anaerolineae bacterium]|nr:hypothetical protein [Anaerolineae bacterium]